MRRVLAWPGEHRGDSLGEHSNGAHGVAGDLRVIAVDEEEEALYAFLSDDRHRCPPLRRDLLVEGAELQQRCRSPKVRVRRPPGVQLLARVELSMEDNMVEALGAGVGSRGIARGQGGDNRRVHADDPVRGEGRASLGVHAEVRKDSQKTLRADFWLPTRHAR
eukprot:445021-Hanusia_phi.AAC.2